ncbi:MAG: bifunctional riboflavin kinase/FAD synthetase [Porphyromonadaceae bacterium]|nr:bifunctional riboflavin kinase/FAD synthetase [Porphyromonadaceae bacterium]
MFIYKNNDAVPWEKCIATVGFFDGVHGGHRFLLNELNEEARKKDCISVVITFNIHPRKILKSDFQPRLLTTLEEKLELLSTTGVDACYVLDFTHELSLFTAQEFIEKILFEKLHVRSLLVGHDHRFGHNREEGFEDYCRYGKDLGMNVIQAAKFTVEKEEHFSSSQIRTALRTGDIERANKLLTYPYTFVGKVIGGYKNGRKIGFPTANIWFENKEKIVPAIGVYAVRAYVRNRVHIGMMNIGYRPTISSDGEISMEVHIIDFDYDIYNHYIKIECIHRIRDEMKFNGIDELVAQLKKDKENVIRLLK